MLNVKDSKPTRAYKGFKLSNLGADYKIFLFLSSIFAVGWFSYSFLLVYAKQAGFGISSIPVVYLTFTLVASITSIHFGRLADRIGRKYVLALSFAFFGMMCLGFIFIKDYYGIFFLFVIYGLHRASIEPVQKTIVAEFATEEHRATMLGTYQMVIGILTLPASLIAGLLWKSVGSWAPFMLSFLLSLIATFMLVFMKEPKPSRTQLTG